METLGDLLISQRDEDYSDSFFDSVSAMPDFTDDYLDKKFNDKKGDFNDEINWLRKN